MEVKRINSTQSFQALNLTYVATSDRINVYKYFRELQKLGESYNIRLTSTFADRPGFSAIEVDVFPLRKKLGFWQKIFPPIGRSVFQGPQTPPNGTENTILNAVQKAIKDLQSKTEKKYH